MSDYMTSILKRKNELEGAIVKAEIFLGKAPSGTIRTSTTNGLPQFYHVTAKTTPRGKFISKTKQSLISNLIQKEYSELFLRDAAKELKAINALLERIRDFQAERTISKLHRNKISYVKPYLLSDEEFARRWDAMPYKTSDYKVQKYIEELFL